MRSIDRIEIFANGTIKAPCHLFSMGHDIHATTVFFRRISIRMGLLTGTVLCLVFYIYLRRLLTYEKLVHDVELFRHNWCVETEDKEKQLGITEKNRLFDTSLLDGNIDEPNEDLPQSHNTTKSEDGDKDGDEELLGLLPRDKLVTFPNPVRMRIECYLVLIFTFMVVWIINLIELTFHATGHNSRHLFTNDNYGYAWMYQVLKAHRKLMDFRDDRHKCMGTMQNLKSGLSSSVMTTLKVFVYDRSLGSTLVPICASIMSLAILLDLAVQGLFLSRLNHRGKMEGGKRYVYFFNVGNKFFISFFVFTLFLALTLMTEQHFWEPDRSRF